MNESRLRARLERTATRSRRGPTLIAWLTYEGKLDALNAKLDPCRGLPVVVRVTLKDRSA